MIFHPNPALKMCSNARLLDTSCASVCIFALTENKISSVQMPLYQ